MKKDTTMSHDSVDDLNEENSSTQPTSEEVMEEHQEQVTEDHSVSQKNPTNEEPEEESMDPLTQEGETAADYLEELLDIADMDGDIDTYAEAGRPHVSIDAPGDVLVGKKGEVLEALQDLSRLAILTKLGRHSRLMLDISGHRERRRQELKDIVTAAVGEVKETGQSMSMAAMNPFERKIVHDAVAEAGLWSESEGEGDKRHVVISPAASS